MDDNHIKESLEHFDSVWQRVSACASGQTALAEAHSPGAETVWLRAFIEAEYTGMTFYNGLARRTRGPSSAALTGMAADSRRRMCLLQLEYFLLTGDSFSPRGAKPAVNGLLTGLRQAYISEGVKARKYIEASALAGSADLRELYRANAAEGEKHQRTLRGIIAKAMR